MALGDVVERVREHAISLAIADCMMNRFAVVHQRLERLAMTGQPRVDPPHADARCACRRTGRSPRSGSCRWSCRGRPTAPAAPRSPTESSRPTRRTACRPPLGPRTAARRQQIAHVRLQARDVVDRIEQPVGMIDAEAGDLAFADQPQNQAVRGLEDLRIFHAHAGQLVHVEEAAVVDLVRRRPPVGQPIGLLVEQRVQPIEAARIAGRAVPHRDRASMCSRDGRPTTRPGASGARARLPFRDAARSSCRDRVRSPAAGSAAR